MAKLSVAGCVIINPHVRIPEFILGVIITTTNVIWCVRSVQALTHRQTAKNIQIKIKLACGLIVILFAIESILHMISSGVTIFCDNGHYQTRVNIHITCAGLILLLYPLSLLSIYLLFGFKLIDSFKDSIIQVSQCNKTLFYSSVLIQWICFFITQTVYISVLFFPKFVMGNIVVGIIVFLFTMIVYGITFIMLLRLFYIQVNACAHTLFENNTKAQISLFNMSVRQMNCCVIALSSSIINIIIYIVAISLNFNLWIYTVHVIAANVDFTLNSMLLMLQYRVFDKEYYQFCYKCDLLCKYCFRNQLIHVKNQQHIKMDTSTRNNNSMT